MSTYYLKSRYEIKIINNLVLFELTLCIFIYDYLCTWFNYLFNISGDWIIILVHFLKHIGSDFLNIVPLNDTISSNNGFSMETLGLQNLQYFVIMGAIGSFGIYFLIGGFIHVNILILKIIKWYTDIFFFSGIFISDKETMHMNGKFSLINFYHQLWKFMKF